MARDETLRGEIELRATSGPTAVSLRLQPPGPATVGRRSTNSLQLNDPAVSRDHAVLTYRPPRSGAEESEGEWLLHDLGSTHGTWLNGVRIKANRQYHLRQGDLIVVGPWTLLAADPYAVPKTGTTFATVDDADMVGTMVASLETASDAVIPRQGLERLQRCLERIHSARSREQVFEAALDAAVSGTGFTRAAFLPPPTDPQCAQIVASRGHDPDATPVWHPSRALLQEAAKGFPARLCRGNVEAGDAPGAMGAVTALCLPIKVESAVTQFLYLDRPENVAGAQSATAGEEAYATALARIAAMGIASVLRSDIERRQEKMEGEIQAATEAKSWLLPQRRGSCGPFTFAAETRAGKCLGGDFLDVIPLDDRRLAVVCGDVSGTGIGVSVLVSATHGFVHACLALHGDPSMAVAGANRLYHSRIAHSLFVKLWVGLFDAEKRLLTYVDAGHGNVLSVRADMRCEVLESGDHPAVGVTPDADYRSRTVLLAPGGSTLILSDGFVGQRSCDPSTGTDADTADEAVDRRSFGILRVQECLQGLRANDDIIAGLFAALETHTGTPIPDDDASALLIQF